MQPSTLAKKVKDLPQEGTDLVGNDIIRKQNTIGYKGISSGATQMVVSVRRDRKCVWHPLQRGDAK
jgi:hypothetical protein